MKNGDQETRDYTYSKYGKNILNDANDGMHVNEKNNRQNKQI